MNKLNINKGRSKPERIDPDFRNFMKNAAMIRVKKGLAELDPKENSIREMTNLLTKTQGFVISMEELENKPKKR